MDSDELRVYFANRSGGLSTYQKRELKKLLEIAIARAEVAEARADALEDANAVLSDALESTRRKLEKMTAAFTAPQAAGEWRPRVPGPIFNADSAPHGVKSILYLSVDATRDLDSGLWDWDDNGDWYVHGYQPLPTPPADDSERYNPREPAQ